MFPCDHPQKMFTEINCISKTSSLSTNEYDPASWKVCRCQVFCKKKFAAKEISWDDKAEDVY